MNYRPEGWDSREIASHVKYDPEDPQMAMLLMIEAGADAMLEALEKLNRTLGTRYSGKHHCFGHDLTVFIPEEEQ